MFSALGLLFDALAKGRNEGALNGIAKFTCKALAIVGDAPSAPLAAATEQPFLA